MTNELGTNIAMMTCANVNIRRATLSELRTGEVPSRANLAGEARGAEPDAAQLPGAGGEGLLTLDELGIALEGLDETRRTAERELSALQSHREALEQLESDKEALLDYYARVALDSLTPEERHRLYRMFKLNISIRPDTTLEVSGVFGRDGP